MIEIPVALDGFFEDAPLLGRVLLVSLELLLLSAMVALAVKVKLVRTRDAALGCARGDLRLCFCPSCGFVWNAAFDPARMVALNQATNTLVPLRTTVSQLTTWPFRNTVAFGRAVLIASAPLVYAALSELIRVFWIAPMGR